MNPNAMHLPDGTLLAGGKYRIVRFIGAGGFGCTYEAEFVPMGSRVAIKEFFVSACCNRDATGAVSVGIQSQKGFVGKLEEKFRREAKRLFNLKYPGIVGVSDILEENGTSYYVMDYIAGRSLQQIIEDEGPLPEARAVRYIGQVMDALEYVHNKNMLHLDIKPDNIMVDAETDRAILIDFGVSKQYDEADGHNTSTIMGQTPGFAPLEQFGNSVKQFTPATDIYALGATLYALLTGKTPPSSADLSAGAAHLSPLPAGTSPALQRAIGTMMQPNLKRRVQSISQARALLSRIENLKSGIENTTAAAGETKTAPLYTAPTPATTDPLVSAKSSRKKWLWAAIAVAVIAIGIVVFLILGKGSEKHPDPVAATDTAQTTLVATQDTAQDETLEDADNEPVEEEPAEPASEQTIAPQKPEPVNESPSEQTAAPQKPEPVNESPSEQIEAPPQPEPENPKPAGRTDVADESVMLACEYKPTGEQRFFTQSEWNAVSNKSDYIQLGVGVNYSGHKFIVARADASSSEFIWAENNDNDVPGLPNIIDREEAKRDFDGQGNTNKIINAISTNGIAYPAASAARGYKAVAGEHTKWSLPAAGQLWLIYEHLQAINNELAKYGMAKIGGWYWSSTEYSSANAWSVSMTYGYITYYSKNYTFRVRAVAPVLVPAVPAK